HLLNTVSFPTRRSSDLDDVAEAEARLRRGEELLLVEILAAEDAVDVGDGDLDLLVLRPGELAQDRVRLRHAAFFLSSTVRRATADRKSTRLTSSHGSSS